MTDAVTPRWQVADEAVESLTAALVAVVAQTAKRSFRKRPRGRARPKGTRRHIAEVIRSRRLAPGLRVDRNMVAALLLGHRDLVSNPVLVVAVAQAASIIAGRKLSAKKAARMRAASIRVAKLIARAQADMPPVAAPPAEPAPGLADARTRPSEALAPPAEPAPELVEAVSRPSEDVTPPVTVAVRRRRRRYTRHWWVAAAVVFLVVIAILAFA